VQHEHRRGGQRPAFVRPALAPGAVVLTLPTMLNERPPVASSPAAAQLAVEALDPLRGELAQRQRAEGRADKPVDEPGAVVAGGGAEFGAGQPFVEQRAEAGAGATCLPGVDLAEELGAQLLGLLLGVADATQPQPLTGNRVDAARNAYPQTVPRWTTLPRSRLFAIIATLLVTIAVNRRVVPASHLTGIRRWEARAA